MPIHLGTETILIPLTKEVFGQKGKRVLRGAIEHFSRGTLDILGSCLCTSEGYFFHPGFFRTMPSGLHGWVRITLKDNELVIQAKGSGELEGRVFKIPPLELVSVPLEDLLDFAKCINEEKYCMADSCDGAVTRELDIHRSVFIRGGDEPDMVMCGKCYDQIVENDPIFEMKHLILDGRRILFHAPVPVLSQYRSWRRSK